MRFQTSETVSVQDPEMVLRVLEMCLREISNEVVRYGASITLQGLGPSPRAVNYHDTTVLSVSTENDKTIIHADVSFQASAFLGEMSQDAIVRSKLEQVFDQMKTQLDLELRRESASFVAPVMVDEPVVEAESESTELPVDDAKDVASSPVSHEAEEHLDEGEGVTALPMDSVLQDEPQIVHTREIPPEESDARHSKLIWFVCAVGAFSLLAVGTFLPRFRDRTVGWYSAAMGAREPIAAKTADSTAVGETVAPQTNAAATSPDSSALPAPSVEDPKVWLETWAAAMRSRDPVAQASFYADPVDRYLNRKNVSNAALVEKKRADIGRRQSLWTVRLSDVVVENRTPSEATVRLVKHYIVEGEPSQVSELFVKTRLQLKLIDGQWKIASEQEIRAAAAASIDPIDQ